MRGKHFYIEDTLHGLAVLLRFNKGIMAIARHKGFDIEQTIAFGDGGNDLSMILKAGTGIAMANATDSLKLHADYITDSVDQDGILNALQHFNVILH